MNDHKIYDNIKTDNSLREMFFSFTKTIFPSVDFSIWYDHGFWSGPYCPHAIVDNNKIVANVSASVMDLIINGTPRKGLQLGTVGTLPAYRGKGLSKILMEHIIEKYRSKVDLMFLYANDTVTSFYPRFGFRQHTETIFTLSANLPRPAYSLRKLDINNDSDIDLIQKHLTHRLPLTRLFGAENYRFITLWHVLNIFPDNLYYQSDHDLIVIASHQDGRLAIFDIIFHQSFDIKTALPQIIPGNTTAITFHFPPDCLDFPYDNIVDSDDLLFIKGHFPADLEHFKLPVTAQT